MKITNFNENKSNQPLVSIIITTQNRSKILKCAIESSMNQSYNNIEIIIINDCSRDDTEEIITHYMKQDKRIKYLKNNKVSGSNFSRNKGILASKGYFIAGLDDDDEFTLNRIELLVKNHVDSYSFITTNDIYLNSGQVNITSKKSYIKLNDMLYSNKVGNQGLIKRERLIKVGMYDENLSACQDYDLWMRLIIKYGEVKVMHEATQIINIRKTIQRISTNSKSKYYGYFNFYKKYKFLMNSYYKKINLIRIYDIRNNTEFESNLAIKILIKKIEDSNLKDFSIFGFNNISIEIVKFMNKKNIRINYLIDSYNHGKHLGNYKITKLDEIKNNETNFIICSVVNHENIRDILFKHNLSKKLTIISI